MAVLSDYTSGRISLANGSTTVTGTGTLFNVAKFREGDTLQIQNLTAVIASVNSDTSLTLTAPWTGTTLTNAVYRARYLPDGARVTAQATTLIELLGNGVLTNIAELGVEEGKAPVGGPSGQYELKPVPTDPNGSLAKLAALVLAANKILRTDASGNASQGDLTNAAAALLALAGAANQLPYFSGANTAALTSLTAAGRAGINTAGTAAANTMAYNMSATASALTPLTAKGRAIIGASANDAILAEILAAPRPSASGRGLYASFSTSPGAAATLPSGGTYSYWLVAYDAPTGTLRSPIIASIQAGGTTIGSAAAGWIWSGVYWNLT